MELKVGDRIQHKSRKKKNPVVIWKVVDIAEWKYYTMVRIRSERTGIEVTKRLSSFADYQYAGYIKPVKEGQPAKCGNPFTYKDKVIIAENHGILSNERIADMLGRNKQSIANMAHRMRKTNEFTMKSSERAINIRVKNELIMAFETLDRYCTGTKCGECLIKTMCDDIRSCDRIDQIAIDEINGGNNNE